MPITATLFFEKDTQIWILKIPLKKFEEATKWDVEGTDGCAHLYGNFGRDDVEAVKGFKRAAGEAWNQVFAHEGWLE